MDYSGKIIRKTPVTPSQTSASGVWSLDEALQAQRTDTWPVANVPDPISRSLRFRSSASAYLNRTFGSGGSTTAWTWSGWVKRGYLGSNQTSLFFGDSAADNYAGIYFTSDTLNFINRPPGAGQNAQLVTTQVFRDPSAWYHIVAVWNTASATSTDRLQLYVNGTRITSFSTALYPAQNTASIINTNIAHELGCTNAASSGVNNFFDGYLTEVQFIGGQALTPSSFGGTNAVTGVWEPRVYTGTYGTNGFYLPFSNNTNTTTLGNDFSGNNNTWTTNNFSLTAGATYDSMLDVPTQWIGYNTGNPASATRGNYATLNPIVPASLDGTSGQIINGNLRLSTSTVNSLARATVACPTIGKFYAEATITLNGGGNIPIGVTTFSSNSFAGGVPSVSYRANGVIEQNGSTVVSGLAGFTTGDVISMAVNMDAGEISWYKNNTLQVTRTNLLSLFGTNDVVMGGQTNASSSTIIDFNFGQRPFTYTPPAGFRSLCTTNLPNPTILQGDDYFNALLYTGNGTSQTISGLEFSPDFVWVKERSSTSGNVLFDVIRGATNYLESNTTGAEAADASTLTSFNSNGFSVGSSGAMNQSSQTYVAWNWNAGGTTVTNTAGSISAQVRANPTAGFSIVTYTLNNSTFTVGHGLGVAPRMIIVKNLDTTNNWDVYTATTGAGARLQLNSNAASQSSTQVWNNTSPTSTVFSGNSAWWTNPSTSRMVAYCFAPVAGYSAFGSYTGNGNADGPFVYLGFRPEFVMYKRTDDLGGWIMYDATRDTSNVVDRIIEAQSSGAESSGSPFADIDFVSNGFKARGTSSAVNASGGTYIYMAFAENPFKNALAR